MLLIKYFIADGLTIAVLKNSNQYHVLKDVINTVHLSKGELSCRECQCHIYGVHLGKKKKAIILLIEGVQVGSFEHECVVLLYSNLAQN